jgi:charged multivesicular body protein 4
MFGRLFGTGGRSNAQKPPPADLNTSIQKLRQAIVTLDKREEHLGKKIAECVDRARTKSKHRDKKGALFELKKKKQLEGQLQSIQGKKLNLETQIMTLEDAFLNKETLNAMQTSAQAMRSAMRESDVEKADELMEDITDAMEQVNEMNEAMAQPLGAVMDEDELEAELAELEEMEADELLSAMPATTAKNTKEKDVAVDVPDVEVPTHKVVSKQTEEDELAELEAMIS